MSQALPVYELCAIRYATRDGMRRDHFLMGDPHDAPMPMDYFVWAARAAGRTVVIEPRLRNQAKEMEASMSSSSENPRERIRPIVPKLIDLTERVLFSDVWERPGLSKRDRSLITVAALVALYRPEQLRIHLGRALDNGLSKEELGEVITIWRSTPDGRPQ
jgi:4-carboxymuconolactone decarboxylase